MNVQEILAENKRRMEAEKADSRFDPCTGIGCSGRRRKVPTPVAGLPEALIPEEMLDDPDYEAARADATAWQRLRCRHDFEYWCAVCATVKHKLEGRDVPFMLNRPQRRVAAIMEADRRAGRPIRLIMLKARQWGGSTLVQMYMAWIQSCHRRNWNSLICAHVKDTAASIRGMYTKMLAAYPEQLWEGDCAPQFKPFERSTNIREISGRGCRVTLGSSENQEAARGGDYAMAHLSETAFYASTQQRSPDKFIQAICGGIAYHPYTLIAMESTANGVGNYFHSEWLRCEAGKGDKHAVFVPWYEIDIYRLEPEDAEVLAGSLDDYELALWNDFGLTLDRIWWYRCKSREYSSREQMQANFPTTAQEAFINSGSGVFDTASVERLRLGCRRGECGELGSGGSFVAVANGKLEVWERPAATESYVVAVDVGGRSASSDWSVIAVLRRGPVPAVAAQWRGHCDHDRLADEAVRISRYYNNALLMIESNTLETENTSGDPNLFVLSRLSESYGNLYRRSSYDSVTRQETSRVGFHTNRATKALLIGGLIEAVREGGYEERDSNACNELLTYEQLPNGAYAAKQGYHDDILMTRAMALLAISQIPRGRMPDRKAMNYFRSRSW
ncbi:MAG: hypothetical protein K2H03_08385 [Muribaculaceae bacterium]|nr:hypothetical protein [Muribaculaceae bacterium]